VVESGKSASDIYAPISGEVSAVNGDLDTAPEKINENAYEAWILKLADKSELASLPDAEACQMLIETRDAGCLRARSNRNQDVFVLRVVLFRVRPRPYCPFF
jgi:hypothetical protein